MSALAARLTGVRPVIMDGAMATELMKRGLSAGESPETWNLGQPDAVRAVTAAYAEAGAEVVQTNTFGGSALRLATCGLQSRCEEVNRAGVRLARAGAAGALVVGTIGPSGTVHISGAEPQLAASFGAQARALAVEGVDGFLIETMMDVAEAEIALSAVRTVARALPAIVTLAFAEPPSETRLAAVVARLTRAGAAAIGANCGHGMAAMIPVARLLAKVSTLPIVIRASAGLPMRTTGGLAYPEGPESFAQSAQDVREAGAVMIGGCCGTTPAHIKALRELWSPSRSGP